MLNITTMIFVGLVAALHLYFLTLEMFLWQKPLGLKTFGMSKDQAALTAVLAENQGLYNGFLASGLIWSFFLPGVWAFQLRLFLLACIFVAGIYGGFSANKRIIFVQALPALIAAALVYYNGSCLECH